MSDRDIKMSYSNIISLSVEVSLCNNCKITGMAVRRKKILTTILEWLLYIILVSGIMFLLVILGIAPFPLVDGKLAFIIPHKIIGYIFFILIVCHAFTHRKWYKAWASGKTKKTKNNQITRLISILFLFMIILFPLEGLLPRKIWASLHSVIGITWIILMINHIRTKRKIVRKHSQNIS